MNLTKDELMGGGISYSCEMTPKEVALIEEIRSWNSPISFALEDFLSRQPDPKLVRPEDAVAMGFVVRVLENGFPQDPIPRTEDEEKAWQKFLEKSSSGEP